MRHPSRKTPDVKTLKPGMTVYLLPCDNKQDRQRVVEGEIVKIGRKYISVKRKTDSLFPILYQFDFTDGYNEKPGVYGWSYLLFFSMEEIDDYFLHQELMKKVNTEVNYAYYLNTHQLKQICDLLEKGKRIYQESK